jgi:RecA-family ATPase
MLRYVCSLPNADTVGSVREFFSNDDDQIEAFVKGQDGFGKGVYDCIGLFPSGATRRSKETVAALPIVVVDLDLQNIDHTREEVLQVLDNMMIPATEVRDSGNGLHAVWKLKEPLTGDDMARGERVMKRLAELLAGDKAPTHRAALLRRPGSTNTKGGHNKPCRVLVEHSDAARVTDITEIEEMLDLYDRPLLNPKPIEPQQKDGVAPSSPADLRGEDGRLDIDACLATMRDGKTVNLIQPSVICALINKAWHPEEIKTFVVDATMKMAERMGLTYQGGKKWDRAIEEEAVLQRINSALHGVFEREYDYTTGTIPIWLNGDFHNDCAKVLKDGRVPTLTHNKYGWFIKRQKGPATVEAAEETAPASSTTDAEGDIKLESFMSIDEKDIPPRQFLYGRQYQRQVVSATAARGGVGKSSKKIVEGIAMATARNLLGVQPEMRCRVWLHNGEDNRDELTRRIVAACKYHNVPMKELEGWFFPTTGVELPLKVARGYQELNIDNRLVGRMMRTIAKNGIDVFIVDPLITIHGTNESDNGRMDQVMRILSGIAAECDISVDISHHTRKLGIGADDAGGDDARGASAIRDAVRFLEFLNVMSLAEAGTLGIDEYERLSYFRADQGKANTAPPPKKANWFKFVDVELANGDNVGVATVCDLDEKDSHDVEVAAEAMFLRLLDKLTMRGEGVSHKSGSKYAPNKFSKEPEAKKARIGKGALESAMNRLLDKGFIEIFDNGFPSRPSMELRRRSPSITPPEGGIDE